MVAASLAALTGPAVPATAAAGTPTCFGLRATITAPAGTDRVRGTEGDDVIVVEDASYVFAMGGDDAVCATGDVLVNAGDGDDRVRTRHAHGWNQVLLGRGSDLFEGSGGNDDVYAEYGDDYDSDPGPGPDNTDVVRTYGGKDHVHVGDLETSDDQVDLGAGDDRLDGTSPAMGAAKVTGGPGTDLYVFNLYPPDGARLSFDLAAGTAATDGVQFSTLRDIEVLRVYGGHASLVEVQGTDGPDRFYVGGRAHLDAGGGDDRIALFGDPEMVVGGPGHDKIEMRGYSDDEEVPVVIDLGRKLFTRRDVTARFEAESLDVLTTGARQEFVSIIGTSGPDEIRTEACGSVVRGAGGDDKLRAHTFYCDDRSPATLYGGPGNDTLRGWEENDVLLGGAGSDRALGGDGIDRCRAEIEWGCERD